MADLPAANGRRIGYARVSSTDQDTAIQRERLSAAGCTVVLEEKITGTKRLGREKLDVALQILSPGDQLVVVRLDRLGRSMRDLANIAEELKQKGAHLKVLDQDIDTTTSLGRAVFGMLATFAEFENDIRRDRQLAGIAKAKVAGVYRGRAHSVDAARVHQLKTEGKGVSAIARELGVSRPAVYDALRLPPEEAVRISSVVEARRKRRAARAARH